jgi:hypothetical protein
MAALAASPLLRAPVIAPSAEIDSDLYHMV